MHVIRLATLADVPAIFKLEQESPGASHWDEQEYSRILQGHTAAERVVLVAEQHEKMTPFRASQTEPEAASPIPDPLSPESKCSKLLAFIVARVLGPECEIENLAVCAAVRRQRVGTRLIGEIVQLARIRGATAVHLEVRQSNTAARALYESCGFVKAGSRAGYYCDPPEDAITYRHQLLELFSKPVEGV